MKDNLTLNPICPVLIVDDDNDLCTILGFVITNKCSVHVEHTLKNAENYMARLEPSIILLDNDLPDGSGVKFIKSMLELYPEVKIVLMTADRSEGLAEKAMQEGAARFIAKPFKASLINEIIFSLCPELRAA